MGSFRICIPSSGSGLLTYSVVESISKHLRAGGLAVLPTETGHMLAALATSEPALLRAFRLKQRPLTQPMHVACASLDMAARYAVLPEDARRLLAEFTPGPLTVIVAQSTLLPDRLVTLNGTVGIRIPDHPATLQVIADVGVPLTATSLNRSGEESQPVSRESLEGFDWDDQEDVPVVLDNEAIRYSAASTLVRFSAAGAEILRAGPVSKDQVDHVLASLTVAGRPR